MAPTQDAQIWQRMITDMSKSLIAIFGLMLMSACSSNPPKVYPNTLDKNMKIQLNVEDSGLKSTSAYVYVKDFENGCPKNYLGYLDLTDGVNYLGLAPGTKTKLGVTIKRSFLSNSSRVRYAITVTPKKGAKYELEVNYIDNMTDMRLYEVRGKKRKQLPIIEPPSCNS